MFVAETIIVTETDTTPTAVCPECGSSQLHEDRVNSAFWHGDRLVAVRDIPAVVCDNCRSQFYDDTTVAVLDLMRGDGFPAEDADAEIIVPVFTFRERMDAQS